MDPSKPSETRVVLARRLAARWLSERASPEYRVKVYTVGSAREKKQLPNLLRSFRDARVHIGSMEPIPDLGVREGFDHFVLWSSDGDALMKLSTWLESKGYETTGIW